MATELSSFQQGVLARMRKKGLHFIASTTESLWKQGQTYYIDTRVNAKGIRRDFDKGNRQAADCTKGTNNK